MDVGLALRQARERRGLSLEHIARTTKITRQVLEAIENNDVDRLPSAVYVRGFVRSYAHEVGLDDPSLAEQYLAQFQPAVAIQPSHGRRMEARSRSHVSRSPLVGGVPMRYQVLAGAAVLGAVIVGSLVLLPARPMDPPPAAALLDDITQASAPMGIAETAAPMNEAGPAMIGAPGEVLRIRIAAIGPCWVSASADRTNVLSRLLSDGETTTIEMRDELVLRVGDPGTFTFTIDGVPGRSLGRAGVPVTVHLTRENFREFLAS